MRNFFKYIVFCILPFFGICVFYILWDPYLVVRKHSDYKECVNPAYRSVKLMEKNKTQFNAFIVGSSRSLNFHISDWKEFLSDGSNCMHLDQNGDVLYGAKQRLKYVYERYHNIQDILLVIDRGFLSGVLPPTGIYFMTPYQMTDESDYFRFQYKAFTEFFSIEGLLYYFKRIHSPFYFTIDETNEPNYLTKEWAIQCDPDYYYTYMVYEYPMYDRDGIERIGEPVLGNENIKLLKEIKELFSQQGTRYKIVISPLYDQVRFNPTDLYVLDSIFGTDNVYDYSGVNDYTNNRLNYYESSHYRPCLARRILEDIYKKSK